MSNLNQQGLTKNDYMGAKSTLCTGCGHDSITSNIINALFLANINPYDVAKMSGIGCSSKTTNYFLNASHGFNSIHGRMAPLATGAKVANHKLLTLGVSGDGDTASIGLGGFAHLIRRNLPMVYIVENNGVYGLTKGQFSATADRGSLQKNGNANPFETIDICSLSIDLGCSFVARSFSGDNKQLTAILMAAMKHRGTAVIDIISPCITFANHDGSTKSFQSVKEHLHPLNKIDLIQPFDEIHVDYEPGTTKEVEMHDGSKIILSKVGEDHDVKDASSAIHQLIKARHNGEILTGLFYVDESHETLLDTLQLCDTPLSQLSEDQLLPDEKELKSICLQFK
ncbi:MAG: thiamine pyrophosphate-dependent enzyme [Bdellovibrionales bacterium]